jgi:predicted Zn-dependent peptidase
MTGTLLNSMLGGDAHSQLFNVIREEMGLAYQVFSLRLAPLSALFILAGVSPESVETAITAIEEQVDHLAKGEFDDRLVAQSRQMLESAIFSAYDSLSDMLEIQASSRLSGFYPDRDHMIHKIRTISRVEIQACAQRLKLGLVFVLTADKADRKSAEDEHHD